MVSFLSTSVHLENHLLYMYISVSKHKHLRFSYKWYFCLFIIILRFLLILKLHVTTHCKTNTFHGVFINVCVMTFLKLNLEISFPLHTLKTLFNLNFKVLQAKACYYLEKIQSDIDNHNNSSNPDTFQCKKFLRNLTFKL